MRVRPVKAKMEHRAALKAMAARRPGLGVPLFLFDQSQS